MTERCGKPCKGLYDADTWCGREPNHRGPCAPAVMTHWAECETQRQDARAGGGFPAEPELPLGIIQKAEPTTLNPDGHPATARQDFARIVEDRLDFVTGYGSVREADAAAILAAADEYRAEGLRASGAHLDEVARTARHPEVTERMARYAKGTLEAAAEMARHWAKGDRP